MRRVQQRRWVMKVKDVMHKGVDWVSPDTPVTELAKLMREHDIGAIPIGENDRLIGMVTDRDIVCKGLAQDSFDARATARDVMTPGIHCCRSHDAISVAPFVTKCPRFLFVIKGFSNIGSRRMIRFAEARVFRYLSIVGVGTVSRP